MHFWQSSAQSKSDTDEVALCDYLFEGIIACE